MLFFYCYMMITDFFLVVFFQNHVVYCWVLSRFYYWRLQGNSVPLWGCAKSLLYWQFLPAPAPSFGVTHENFNSFWWGLHYENIREERKVLGLQAKVWRGEAVVKSNDWCWQTVMFRWKGKLKCHVHFCVFFVIKLWSRLVKCYYSSIVKQECLTTMLLAQCHSPFVQKCRDWSIGWAALDAVTLHKCAFKAEFFRGTLPWVRYCPELEDSFHEKMKNKEKGWSCGWDELLGV